MSANGFKIVYKGGEGEIVEKKSRFIAYVKPVDTEEEAAALSHKEIAAMREELIARALEIYQSKDELFGAEQMREV